MAYNSSDVSAGDDILATDHNNLRLDLTEIRDSNGNLLAKIAATAKLYLDGSFSGNTYITEEQADLIGIYAGGTNYIKVTHASTKVEILGAHLEIDATKALYFDGGANTFIQETSDDVLDTYVGGTNYIKVTHASTKVEILGAHLEIDATKGLYFDGGSDTYITESSANVLGFDAGGNTLFQVGDSGGVSIGASDYNPVGLQFHGASNDWQCIIDTGDNATLFFNQGTIGGSWTTRYKFQTNGTALADVAWDTFSPDIRKHEIYKDKEIITESDYLDWALEDAKKPVKPYEGIPVKKKNLEDVGDNLFETSEEAQAESDKYVKDIAKIGIGTARWCEWARTKITDLENRIKALEAK
jgi:hypothetical protein